MMASPLGGLPRPPMFDSANGVPVFSGPWGAWFSVVQRILQATSQSGTTAQRPSANLYVGQFYFDTTLALPIWLKTPGAAPVWVNASGTPV